MLPLDVNECRSEVGISFFWRSVYIQYFSQWIGHLIMLYEQPAINHIQIYENPDNHIVQNQLKLLPPWIYLSWVSSSVLCEDGTMGFAAETTNQAQISLPRHDLLSRPSTQRRDEEWGGWDRRTPDQCKINNYDRVQDFATIPITNLWKKILRVQKTTVKTWSYRLFVKKKKKIGVKPCVIW